jgi:outer membrane immunogenic protein
MKRILLATVSSLALLGTAAAADRPIYTKAPPALSPNWTGPYVGLNVGAVRASTSAQIFETATLFYDAKLRDTVATLGAQAGYNWQTSNFVLGAEADLNWTNAGASTTSISLANPNDFAIISSTMRWYGTARLRAGVLIAPPTLLYVTGGLAVASVKNRAADDSAVFNLSTSGTRTGWALGAGIEHQFGNNYSVKLEVIHMDFGRKSASSGTYTGRFKSSATVGRVGVNVRW